MIHIDEMDASLLADEESGGVRARVIVTMTDYYGNPVEDVMVSGKWQGLVRGKTTCITDSEGMVTFDSDSTIESGNIKFKVRHAGTYGYTYQSNKNEITKISISTDEMPVQETKDPVISGEAPFCAEFNGFLYCDPEDVIQSFEWKFCNGITTWGSSVTHYYSVAGTYRVTLTTTDGNGVTESTNIIVNVTLPAAPALVCALGR
jgi:PKD repeat protein